MKKFESFWHELLVELKTPKKYEVKDIVLIASVLGVVSSVFDFIFFVGFEGPFIWVLIGLFLFLVCS